MLLLIQLLLYSYYLGIPEGKPGELHLYRVAAGPARNGAPMKPPQCLTCPPPGKTGSPSTLQQESPPPPPLAPARVSWDDEWDEEKEEDVTEPPSTPPTKRKKEKHHPGILKIFL